MNLPTFHHNPAKTVCSLPLCESPFERPESTPRDLDSYHAAMASILSRLAQRKFDTFLSLGTSPFDLAFLREVSCFPFDLPPVSIVLLHLPDFPELPFPDLGNTRIDQVLTLRRGDYPEGATPETILLSLSAALVCWDPTPPEAEPLAVFAESRGLSIHPLHCGALVLPGGRPLALGEEAVYFSRLGFTSEQLALLETALGGLEEALAADPECRNLARLRDIFLRQADPDQMADTLHYLIASLEEACGKLLARACTVAFFRGVRAGRDCPCLRDWIEGADDAERWADGESRGGWADGPDGG